MADEEQGILKLGEEEILRIQTAAGGLTGYERAMIDASLTEELKDYILQMSHGNALVGVASVDRFEGAPAGHHPCDFVPGAYCLVVIGLPIVSGLMNWPEYMAESKLIKEVDTYVDEEGVEQTWSPRTNIRKHVERRSCIYSPKG